MWRSTAFCPSPPPFLATASDNTILIHGPVLKTNFGFGFLNQCLRMGEGLPLKKKKKSYWFLLEVVASACKNDEILTICNMSDIFS